MEVLYADRSDRAKLRFTGEQRGWFLHQIMTQDFDPLPEGAARTSAMLTAHGRMVGFFEAIATGDSILAHFEPELRDTFPDAVRRYVFATRVEIADVTEEYGLVLVAGGGWQQSAAAAAPGAPLHPTTDLGVAAGYIWLPRAEVAGALGALGAHGGREASEDELESIRIRHGVARWGRDMNHKTIPQEACIESFAVHFEKGCYVGQEAMAKINFRGKVNRRLRVLEADARLAVGQEVTLDGTKVGTVTSSADGFALAMLKHTVEPGSVVSAGGGEARVTR